MHLHSLFLFYLLLWKPLGYLAVFIAMVLEGEVSLFAAAFLTHQGFFDIGDIFLTIYAGLLLGDLGWYWLGTHLERLPPAVRHWVERLARPFDDHLLNRTFRTIFISKFTYGVHHALLMRAGALRINLGNFIRYDVIASLIWLVTIGGLGYFFSASFVLIRHYLRYAEIGLLLSILIFFALSRFLAAQSRKRL